MRLRIIRPAWHVSNKILARALVVLSVITLVALAVFALWPHYHVQTQRTKVVESYSYTYTNLEGYKVNGFIPGTGLSFDKPQEFKSTISSTSAPIADLAHTLGGKNNLVIGNIVASGLPPANAAAKIPTSELKSILADPSNRKYAATIKPIQQFVTQKLTDLNIKFGNAQPLSTPNLANDTWKLEFSSSARPGNNIAAFPLKQGVAIWAVGKNTNYYFMVSAVDNNWQANQTTWQKIINSLKVDQ